MLAAAFVPILVSGSRKARNKTAFFKDETHCCQYDKSRFQIMSAYVTTLNTAQTKLNSIGLENLPQIIVKLHSCFRDVTAQLVPSLLKLVTSKHHGELALKNIDLLVKHVGMLFSSVPGTCPLRLELLL